MGRKIQRRFEWLVRHNYEDYKMLEKIDFYGDSKTGFSGSTHNHDGIASEEAGLQNCRRCGGSNQFIKNTHTASYWIECECGIELHAYHTESDGGCYCDLDNDHDVKDINSVKNAHINALQHIIDKWNGKARNA